MPTNMRLPDGRVTAVDDARVELLKRAGATLVSGVETNSREAARQADALYDNPLDKALAAGQGGLSGLSFGLTDLAVGDEGKRNAQVNSGYHTVGNIVGVVGPALLTGGASLGASAATTTGKLAGATLPGLASRLGVSVAEKVGGGAVARMATAGAVEGAAGGLAGAISHAALSDDPVTVQSLTSAIGVGALLGAGGGAIAGGLVKYGAKAAAAVKGAKALDEAAAAVPGKIAKANADLAAVGPAPRPPGKGSFAAESTSERAAELTAARTAEATLKDPRASALVGRLSDELKGVKQELMTFNGTARKAHAADYEQLLTRSKAEHVALNEVADAEFSASNKAWMESEVAAKAKHTASVDDYTRAATSADEAAATAKGGAKPASAAARDAEERAIKAEASAEAARAKLGLQDTKGNRANLAAAEVRATAARKAADAKRLTSRPAATGLDRAAVKAELADDRIWLAAKGIHIDEGLTDIDRQLLKMADKGDTEGLLAALKARNEGYTTRLTKAVGPPPGASRLLAAHEAAKAGEVVAAAKGVVKPAKYVPSPRPVRAEVPAYTTPVKTPFVPDETSVGIINTLSNNDRRKSVQALLAARPETLAQLDSTLATAATASKGAASAQETIRELGASFGMVADDVTLSSIREHLKGISGIAAKAPAAKAAVEAEKAVRAAERALAENAAAGEFKALKEAHATALQNAKVAKAAAVAEGRALKDGLVKEDAGGAGSWLVDKVLKVGGYKAGMAMGLGPLGAMAAGAAVSMARKGTSSMLRSIAATAFQPAGKALARSIPVLTRYRETYDAGSKADPRTMVRTHLADVASQHLTAADSAYEAVKPLIDSGSTMLAVGVAKQLTTVAQYVFDAAPKDPGTAMVGGKSQWKPPELACHEFMERRLAAEYPVPVLADAISNNRYSTVQADTLWHLYPDLMGEARTEFIMAMQDNGSTPIPYARRGAVSVFFRMPYDSLFSKESVADIQSNYVKKEPQGAAPGAMQSQGKPGRPAATDKADGLTGVQALQNQ